MSTQNITLVARFEEDLTAMGPLPGSPVAIEFAVLTHPGVLAVTVDDLGSDDRIPIWTVRVRYAGDAARSEVESLAREAAPRGVHVSAVRLALGWPSRGWSDDHVRMVAYAGADWGCLAESMGISYLELVAILGGR